MKVDAHYYAILAFARACGFKKESAYKIAYASQFVDDAKIDRIFFKNKIGDIGECEYDGESYFLKNTSSTHEYFSRGMKVYSYTSMINNTVPFHFIPACRGDNFIQKLRCFAHLENSSEIAPIAKKILEKTLDNDDVIKLGVILHAYADIFSHQGFSGLLSEVNDIEKLEDRNGDKKLKKEVEDSLGLNFLEKIWKKCVNLLKEYLEKFKDIFKPKELSPLGGIENINKNHQEKFDLFMPAYGHGQALIHPDVPYLIWSYKYDKWSFNDTKKRYEYSQLIDNRERFKEAFLNIENHLKRFINKYPQHYEEEKKLILDNFNELYKALIFYGDLEERIGNWRKIMIQNKLFNDNDFQLNYDENEWIIDAFEDGKDKKKYSQRNVEDAKPKVEFIRSNWYKFSAVIRWYKDYFFKLCREEGLEIPQ